jgi:hypothetical protein
MNAIIDARMAELGSQDEDARIGNGADLFQR